ncbi:hypothetical protein BTZ20_5257 [Rhodococcus sp. MTM3W5.2]|nr:hypothetical protein BTZ20_5257 [Rhodococcus sp. MTM3W5.2]
MSSTASGRTPLGRVVVRSADRVPGSSFGASRRGSRRRNLRPDGRFGSHWMHVQVRLSTPPITPLCP